jgi:oligopeptide transport system ATP-binding protein
VTGTLLSVNELSVHFSIPADHLFGRSNTLKAVDGITFDLAPAETLGVVGESGCGKSTLARGILGLVPVTGGSVFLESTELTKLSGKALKEQRRQCQIIFQDPLASLDPRMTIGETIAEPLRTFHLDMSGSTRRTLVASIMDRVGLSRGQANRYPHELSGGQCQRVGIARALILGPKLIICDEPVSALDVSIQAQIVNLLMDIQRDMGLSLIFIAHDLAVVRHISHRVMVMYLGRAVEIAKSEDLYRRPLHPYTKALIEAVPVPEPGARARAGRRSLTGDLPSPMSLPTGCAFRTRCPLAVDRCATERPEQRKIGDTIVACHRASDPSG